MNRIIRMAAAHLTPEHSFRGVIHWNYLVPDHLSILVIVKRIEWRQRCKINLFPTSMIHKIIS